MKTFLTVSALRQYLDDVRRDGKSVGFVPTMGYLHKGHLSLVESSKKENDVTIVSIFVNPTQFAPNEDFLSYPRNPDADAAMLEAAGTDALFFPSIEEIYPKGHQTSVTVSEVSGLAEGEFRPTHFKGVATVVNILFNIVQPHRAYFGQKDAQQTVVLRRMVQDLIIPVEIVVCPILRENDGLAMSSRNVYLNPEERLQATAISRSLRTASELIQSGVDDSDAVISAINSVIGVNSLALIEYVRVVDAFNFNPVDTFAGYGEYFIIIACRFGKTRLIDNAHLRVDRNGKIIT